MSVQTLSSPLGENNNDEAKKASGPNETATNLLSLLLKKHFPLLEKKLQQNWGVLSCKNGVFKLRPGGTKQEKEKLFKTAAASKYLQAKIPLRHRCSIQ